MNVYPKCQYRTFCIFLVSTKFILLCYRRCVNKRENNVWNIWKSERFDVLRSSHIAVLGFK